jgi:glycosyltransferase involved in cell wall biosynthesis
MATSADGRAVSLLIPGDWSTPTGGYQYDRRLALGLRAAGWIVDVLRVDADWPTPDAAALAHAASRIGAIPDGMRVIADGLAYGVLDTVVSEQARRLRWVALVHHPLHLETGLAPCHREQLRESEARALGFARRVVVTSPRTVRDVEALGVPADRIAVVEPGTDPCARMPTASPAGRAGPVTLLTVATVTPRKGHALLLEALAGLTTLDWRLHCVGSLTRDAATAARVQAMSQALRLAERVVWHGEVDAATLASHLAAADLLVLPSLHEGYGMVVAEALAAGVPVLCSDAGALGETLPKEAGWCVPTGDVPALQAVLRRLIGDSALRRALAEGARQAGRKLPDWPTQAARFAAVLEGMQ